VSESTQSDVYRAPNAGLVVARSDGRAPSRIGFVSLLVGMVGVAALVATFGLAVAWKVVGEPGDAETDGTQNLWIGLVAMASCGVSLVGVCLAIVALIQPDRLRGWAVSGLVINAFVVLVFALLLTIGLMAGE
jgi:hypothetical protein